jgi:ubiquitin-protein ligase E3 A
MLNPESKSLMLSIESDLQQDEQARHANTVETLVDLLVQGPGAVSPYCLIEVRRDHLIEDTMNLLINSPLNFKKELKVKFLGEEGADSGGVRKEFFQLIIRELFDPSYSMFNYNDEARTYWFNSDTFEPRIKFELIGLVIGLALYNSVILDIHFPKVVYKKLMGLKVDFEDLVDFSPSIAQSLDFILKYTEPDLQDMLTCTFSVEVDSYGAKRTVELVPGGSSIYVTQENKQEYVDKYMYWPFDSSIESLFSAFKKGFYKLYSGEMTTNCDPEELQLLICGSPVLDFKDLEHVTTYDGGYTKDSPPVVNFWSIIHELTTEQQKRFLFFATGSDRAPVGGLGSMTFHILKNGEDGEQLPSSHTCFNYLLLPPYASKEKMKRKLLVALNNAEGFGLL